MTPQQAKILKIAKHTDNPNLSTIEEFILLNEKIDNYNEEMVKCMNDMASKEMPEPIDHSEQLKAIMDKLNEPEEQEDIEITLNII